MQVLEHGDSWRLDAVQENSGLEEAEELSEDEEEEDVEVRSLSLLFVMLLGIQFAIVFLCDYRSAVVYHPYTFTVVDAHNRMRFGVGIGSDVMLLIMFALF